MKTITADEILDVFHDGKCLLLKRQPKFEDINVGARILVEGREIGISGVERGRNRLVISVKE